MSKNKNFNNENFSVILIINFNKINFQIEKTEISPVMKRIPSLELRWPNMASLNIINYWQ